MSPFFFSEKYETGNETVLSYKSLPLITADLKEENGFYHLDALDRDFDNLILSERFTRSRRFETRQGADIAYG